MKVLVHDGVGIWLAARRLHQGRFFWPSLRHGSEVALDAEQLQALVLGLAHVMVAKFADHLQLYRQEKIFSRAGLAIARSTLAQWVGQTGMQLQPLVDAQREAVLAQGVIHADETPVQMLAPGEKKTHRAYVWAYSTTPFADHRAEVYDFSPSRAGEHARNFLGQWSGKLVCDDFAGYKASFEQGIIEIGCMAHARRKFFDLHATNKSQLAEQVLHSIAGLYEIERQARDLSDEDRWRIPSYE